MAQPAIPPASFEFSAPLAEVFSTDAPQDVRSGYEGPANRALIELSLVLGAESIARVDNKWGTQRSLRFIVVSCGLFWLTAAATYFVLH